MPAFEDRVFDIPILGTPGNSRNARGRKIIRRRPERPVAQRVGIAGSHRRLPLRGFSLRGGRSQGRNHVTGMRLGGILAIQFGRAHG